MSSTAARASGAAARRKLVKNKTKHQPLSHTWQIYGRKSFHILQTYALTLFKSTLLPTDRPVNPGGLAVLDHYISTPNSPLLTVHLPKLGEQVFELNKSFLHLLRLDRLQSFCTLLQQRHQLVFSQHSDENKGTNGSFRST